MKRLLVLLFGILLHNFSMAQLVVHSARWEVAGGGASCDATRQLTAACNGLRTCRVPVDPASLCGGDPAYGSLKILDINYSCDGVRQAATGFPDGSVASLHCQRRRGNSLLQIRAARWAAMDGAGSCDAYPLLSQACNGKESCEVYVWPRYVCGSDPAFGSVKRLEIDYSCGNRQQNRVGFEDGNFAHLRCSNSAPVQQVYTAPPPKVLHGSNGNSGGSGGLQVMNARWEVVGGGAWCDATPQMARACDGRGACQLPVDGNYLCGGDPAYGKVKRLDIKYMCNGRVQPVVGFQDGSQAILQCGTAVVGGPVVSNPVERQLLQITFARWEVNGGGPWCDALPQMAAACNGRKFCQIAVDPRSLCNGDPAPGRYKTLEVRYTCHGRPGATMGFPDGAQAALRCD